MDEKNKGKKKSRRGMKERKEAKLFVDRFLSFQKRLFQW